jgi:outer membrane protein, heavy metal efflux system
MKTIYRLLFYLTLTSIIRAEEPGVPGADFSRGRLSLREVTNAVLANNPAVKEAENRWRAARERVPQAAAWDDPKVAGDSEVKRYVNIPPNAFMDQSLTIKQLIPITGKNVARARAAAAAALSVFEEVRRAELDVVAKARASFFRLANAYDQLEINDKNLTSLRQIADIARSRYEAGLETAADVLVAETDHSKLLETRQDLQRNLSDAESELNTLMNRDAFAPLGAPLAANMNEANLSLSKLRIITLAQRPEVQMARAKIDGEKSNLQLARRAWIPDPALMVKGQRYNDASQVVSELDAGVSFTVPWVNFRKYSAGVREANANVAAAEHGLDREQKEALRLLRDQLEKIATLHHHVDLFQEKLVPQARQAFEANRLSYESGKATFLDWITAQRNLRDIEATARQHLSDYQVAVAELEAVIGGELYSVPMKTSKERKSP